MKKMVFLGAAALACALAGLRLAAADPEMAWRESLRKVVDIGGLAVLSDTNAVTAATAHTPAYAGQFLFGGAGAGTSGVWVAKGLTTNDWVRVAPAAQ